MTNLEQEIFRAKYKLEYESTLGLYVLTFRSSNYINSSMKITEEAMKEFGKDMIDRIIYLNAEEFHYFVEEM